jgi:hypothetical protein
MFKDYFQLNICQDGMKRPQVPVTEDGLKI